MKLLEPCALCGANRKLERSHIIPQFVYRWAQEKAGKNEVPDGPTRRMLCGRCEDAFSFYESEFARHVFYPLAGGAILSAKYGAWLRKFATSVCWRILEESLAGNSTGRLPARWAPEVASCRETWRRYLTGKCPDVGGHHLHLLPWNAVVGREGRVGPALAAVPRLPTSSPATAGDIQHVITMDVSGNDHDAFVYAKLGPVILLGLMADSAPKEWDGTRINAEGKLKPHPVIIPERYRDTIYYLSGVPPLPSVEAR